MKGATNAQPQVPATNGVLSASSTTTLASATPETITTVTAPVSGVYLAQYHAQLSPGSAGYYLTGINVNTNPGASTWLSNIQFANGDYQRITGSQILPLNAGDRVNFCAYQTTGGTIPLSVWAHLILLY